MFVRLWVGVKPAKHRAEAKETYDHATQEKER